MSFTRSEWCAYLLTALGNPSPSQTTLNFVIGWSSAETLADSGAVYNLLNTTEPWANATNFNSVGVKNYASWQDGINANVATLRNGYYPALEEALRTNQNSILSTPSADILANLHTWCGGCGYGKNFVSLGRAHATDIFEYGSAPQGGNTPVELTQYQIQAANDCWDSVLSHATIGVAVKGTGIYDSWLAELVAGKQYGPPITHEYASIDWSGNVITVQEFAHARCEWNGSPSWYSLGGPA